MKRSLLIATLICFFLQISQGQLWKQKRYETVFALGTSQFFGDIGGYSKKKNILGIKDISFKQTRFNVNFGIKYKIIKDLNARLSLTYGLLHATDNRGSNKTRGMVANTSILEPTLIGEYYFIKSKLENSYLFTSGKRIDIKDFFSALEMYAFTGIGGLSYNVKGNDKLIVLGLQKSGFTAVIPVGLGLNLLFKPEYNLGLEFGYRYTFSDYLDGYTSQQSGSNDVYYFFNFTFTYKLLTGPNGLPSFLNKNRF